MAEMMSHHPVSHRTARTRAVRLAVALMLPATLTVSFAACAPEPNASDSTAPIPDEIAGQGGKGRDDADGESSWAQPEEDIDTDRRVTELPASFPSDAFPVPAEAEIWNTGERGEAWFIVLRATDPASAAQLWGQVIDTGGFTVADEASTPEGGTSATLTNASIRVVAVTIPREDGSVELSYDLTPLA